MYISEQGDCEAKQLFLLSFQTLHIFLSDLERKQHFLSILDCIYHTNPPTNTQILQLREIIDKGDTECACVREKGGGRRSGEGGLCTRGIKLIIIVNFTQPRNIQEENLSKGLFRSSWPVDMFGEDCLDCLTCCGKIHHEYRPVPFLGLGTWITDEKKKFIE